MISADVKADVKQQQTKEQVSCLYFVTFYQKKLQNLK